MPRIEYTAHAKARMAERGVTQEQVEAVLGGPLRRVDAAQGREEVQGVIQRGGRPMLLRVIIEGELVVTVITVIATSKLAKYGDAT